MRVVYWNRRRLSEEEEGELGVQYVAGGVEELLGRVDVVCLCCPLTEETRGMIGERELGLMKRSAVLVNTARGQIVDEAALVRALDDGTIAGAGLDVYEDEPRVSEGLLRNEKALLLPHVGIFTRETMQAIEEWTMENVRLAVEEGWMRSVIPEHRHLQEIR